MSWAVSLSTQGPSRSLLGGLCSVFSGGPASGGETAPTLASGGGAVIWDAGGIPEGGRGDELSRGGVGYFRKLQAEAAAGQACINVILAAAARSDITTQAKRARGAPARGRVHFCA
jgi:hypothetical protein